MKAPPAAAGKVAWHGEFQNRTQRFRRPPVLTFALGEVSGVSVLRPSGRRVPEPNFVVFPIVTVLGILLLLPKRAANNNR